jgi:hypothetical protein
MGGACDGWLCVGKFYQVTLIPPPDTVVYWRVSRPAYIFLTNLVPSTADGEVFEHRSIATQEASRRWNNWRRVFCVVIASASERDSEWKTDPRIIRQKTRYNTPCRLQTVRLLAMMYGLGPRRDAGGVKPRLRRLQ